MDEWPAIRRQAKERARNMVIAFSARVIRKLLALQQRRLSGEIGGPQDGQEADGVMRGPV